MKLIRSGVLSVFAMWAVAVAVFWVSGIGNELQVATTLGAAIVSPVIIIAAFLLWGLPVHLLLIKYRKSSFGWYVLAGFLPGPIFIGFFKPFGNDPFQYLLNQSLFCGVIGIIGAALFWYSMVRKNA
jgi:hypothetical protein